MSVELTQLLYGFLRSLGLLASAAALGSVAWSLVVLRAWSASPQRIDGAIGTSIRIGMWGAGALAAIHLARLFANAHIVSISLETPAFPAFMQTQVFAAELGRAFSGLLLAGALHWLSMSPGAQSRWVVVVAASLAVVVSGAWLVHGASRTEDAGTLMTLTAAHQLGAAMWAGGVLHLLVFWRLGRTHRALRALWPAVLSRFSAVGIAALALLVLTGVPVAITYIGTWYGLIGSAYGSVLLAKGALLLVALLLAVLNFRAARRSERASGDTSAPAFSRAPYTIEAEFGILFAVLFVASALAALPPAVDVKNQFASPQELIDILSPKLPRLVSPTFAEKQAASAQSGFMIRTEAGPEEHWSDFNHNVAGVLVFLIGAVALADRTGRVPWARYWPLGFIALAVFVLVRADTEGWPYGDMSWLEALQRANTFQHKLAVLLTAGLGVMEWRARTTALDRPWLPYVFPALCFVGGIMMLTHAHSAFEVKTDYLVQASHTIIGVLAVLSGCGRWLELRMPSAMGRIAGHLSIAFIVFIGMILAFYREPFG